MSKNSSLAIMHLEAIKTSQVKCAFFFEISINSSENSIIERVWSALSAESLSICKVH